MNKTIILFAFLLLTLNLFSQSISSKKTFIGGSINYSKPEGYQDFVTDYSTIISASPNFYHKFNNIFGFSATAVYGSLPLNEGQIYDAYDNYTDDIDNWTFNYSGLYVAVAPGFLLSLPLGAVDLDFRALLGISLGYMNIDGGPNNINTYANVLLSNDLSYVWEEVFKVKTATILGTSLRIPLKEHFGLIMGVDYYSANYSFEILEDEPEYHTIEVKARQMRYSIGLGARF